MLVKHFASSMEWNMSSDFSPPGIVTGLSSKKNFKEISISRRIFGVRQKIKYLGLSTHRCGSNSVLSFVFWSDTCPLVTVRVVSNLPTPHSIYYILKLCGRSVA